MLEDAAFFTDDSCTIEGPIEPGPSLADWVRLVREGRFPALRGPMPRWSERSGRSPTAASRPDG
ncbi:hypothetical protein [Leucobacter soli]|uniref:hypothetical protein n=1 Tax=Leucobacter soli TaxID=2812850 RepID=UPI003622E395